MSTSRVAVVSATGSGRKRTIPALADSDIARVVAIHGRSPEKLTEMADEFGIDSTYTDLDTMIRERSFDIAVVCSPPFMHLEQVTKLLRAGIPTLVEKPAASTLADVENIHMLAESTGVPVRIAHHLRHLNTYREIRKAVVEGEIGEVKACSLEWSFRMSHSASSALWKLKPELNGLTSLTDAGSHCIDIAIGLFGPGVPCGAFGSRRGVDQTYENVEFVSNHSGVAVHIRASREFGPHSNGLAISGTDGEIAAERFFTERSATNVEIIGAKGRREVVRTDLNPYGVEVEDFIRVVLGQSTDATTTAEAVASATLIEGVERLLGN